MFCPDEDEAFSVQKFLIILSENLAFPFGMNVACVRACISCIWPNTDMYHQFAIAKYILLLGEPYSEQQLCNYCIDLHDGNSAGCS